MNFSTLEHEVLNILDGAEDEALRLGWSKAYDCALTALQSFYSQRDTFFVGVPYEIKQELRKACDRGARRRFWEQSEKARETEPVEHTPKRTPVFQNKIDF